MAILGLIFNWYKCGPVGNGPGAGPRELQEIRFFICLEFSTLNYLQSNNLIMGTIKTWDKWAEAHSYYGLDLLRVALGVFLFVKGVSFMSDLELFNSMMRPYANLPGSWIILHYVAAAHFVGGFFIVIGLLTRWAVAFQFPILFGAIMTNFLGEMVPANLITAIVVLLACLFFFVYGSGKYSSDHYLKVHQ